MENLNLAEIHVNQDKTNAKPLWSHQKKALEIATDRFALFFDPGTGKTRTAIELIKKACKITDNLNKQVRVLIFAPLTVCRNWEREIEEYLGAVSVTVVGGQTKTKKLKLLNDYNRDRLGINILVGNIELLRSKDYRDLLAKCGAHFVIVDESHNFRSPTSLQTKGLFDVVESLNPFYLYLLTGTPAPQGEIDLWSTFKLLKKTKDNFFVWRRRYFVDKNERQRGTDNYWPDYTVTDSAKAVFKQMLSECSLTAKRDDVLDLPPLLHTTIYSELGAAQRRHYETMLEYLFAIDAEGNELNASNILTRTLRLQQLIAGHLGETPIAENLRLDALTDAIELTNDEQFIVWTIFKPTYRDIAKQLIDSGITKFGTISGEQTASARQELIDEFQAGKLRALIAHPRAGGVGINLTAASYSIHYSRGYSLVDDMQAEARNYRGGSEIHKTITRIDIVSPNTIDEDILEALKKKKSAQDFMLGIKANFMLGIKAKYER